MKRASRAALPSRWALAIIYTDRLIIKSDPNQVRSCVQPEHSNDLYILFTTRKPNHVIRLNMISKTENRNEEMIRVPV